MGPFVGVVEIVCGALLLVGLFTRLATIPLLIDICVAILSTKIPILLGRGYGPFHVAQLSRYGFWSMASEARTDFSMLLGLVFLWMVGAGTWSLDARFSGDKTREMRTDV
jgi:putative oxidoreductase